MKKTIFIIIIIILVGSIAYGLISYKEGFEEKRDRILNEITLSIEEATAQGTYLCCIDPPCTMCYLGDWLWDDGTCDCDGMIVKGEWDKVCPQCKKGIEEGFCKSTLEKACDTESEDNFRSI